MFFIFYDVYGDDIRIIMVCEHKGIVRSTHYQFSQQPFAKSGLINKYDNGNIVKR